MGGESEKSGKYTAYNSSYKKRYNIKNHQHNRPNFKINRLKIQP